jgi:hypothetical protein
MTMHRFRTLAFIVPMIATSVLGAVAGAESSTGDLDPRLAGYPEFTVRLTEERIETPASAVAGPTLIIQEQTVDEPGHAFVFRVPDDVPDAEIAEALAGPSVAEEAPEWFWRSEFVGTGDRAAIDRPARALVDLEPGRYIVGDPYRPATEYARFEVTENASPSAEQVANRDADVVAELFEMSFTLPEEVSAGSQIWEVSNTGAMLHEIAIFPVPNGATTEEIQAAISAELEAEFGGDPAKARATVDALGSEWEGWSSHLIAGVGVISPQRVSWAQFDLEPGTYGAVCYIPEPNSMTPHVMLGMTDVFTVTAPDA